MTAMTTATASSEKYICGIYEATVILGRISGINEQRAEAMIENLEGPAGETLEQWQSGTRAELLATFPNVLGDWSFDDADAAYEANPTHQVMFDRADQD